MSAARPTATSVFLWKFYFDSFIKFFTLKLFRYGLTAHFNFELICFLPTCTQNVGIFYFCKLSIFNLYFAISAWSNCFYIDLCVCSENRDINKEISIPVTVTFDPTFC